MLGSVFHSPGYTDQSLNCEFLHLTGGYAALLANLSGLYSSSGAIYANLRLFRAEENPNLDGFSPPVVNWYLGFENIARVGPKVAGYSDFVPMQKSEREFRSFSAVKRDPVVQSAGWVVNLGGAPGQLSSGSVSFNISLNASNLLPLCRSGYEVQLAFITSSSFRAEASLVWRSSESILRFIVIFVYFLYHV